jgi:hypothetical protein
MTDQESKLAGAVSDDIVIASLLVIGMFFPTSISGETRQFLIGTALVLLLGAVLFLASSHGTRPGAVSHISLPILIVLTGSTLISLTFRFGWGILATYSAIAAVFALNLRKVRGGRILSIVFLATNVLLIACGSAVIIGNDRVSLFLTSWYSQFYPDLVPGMIGLHKPVLTFGTHSLAGFFTYLFFWLNWENYKSRRGTVSLVFAISELVLLIALTSFTSFAFALVAILQITFWMWKRKRRVLLISSACIVLALGLTGRLLAEQINALWENPQFALAALNSDGSGLLARYGPGGTLRGTMDFIWAHPFAPIGFTYPSFLLLGDSGPVQYFLRGSILLLLLIYVGLYQFLRYNSPSRKYAVTLFFIFLAFEVGFDALPYFRTAFLLPFLMVYLKEITPSSGTGHARTS